MHTRSGVHASAVWTVKVDVPPLSPHQPSAATLGEHGVVCVGVVGCGIVYGARRRSGALACVCACVRVLVRVSNGRVLLSGLVGVALPAHATLPVGTRPPPSSLAQPVPHHTARGCAQVC